VIGAAPQSGPSLWVLVSGGEFALTTPANCIKAGVHVNGRIN